MSDVKRWDVVLENDGQCYARMVNTPDGDYVEYEDYAAAVAQNDQLTHWLHSKQRHPDYEYETTTGPRKAWYDEDKSPEGEGWERNIHVGNYGWERFDYHEESYWMRVNTEEEKEL